MKEFIKKHETLLVIALIVAYILINSFCINTLGTADYRSFIINFIFSLAIIFFIIRFKLLDYCGLKAFPFSKKYLYYIPLVLTVSVNLWNGFNINDSASKIVFYMLTMLCVGFLEEIIFRGFLFKMMAKNNEKAAVIVSSVTFGVGHVINLLNGAALVETLFQICYATAIGFLFVTIFQTTKSLLPCIIAHSLTNAFSVFSTENTLSLYIAPVFLTVVPIVYTLYLRKACKK